MFLSRLILNSRSPEVRRVLADCHKLHSMILTAFPQVQKKENDGARSQLGVLHRLDVESRSGRIVLLVQSQAKPDWSKLHAEYLAKVAVGESNPACKPIGDIYSGLQPSMTLFFRLRANPTRKIDTRSGADGTKRNGKRVELRSEGDRVEWLRKKGEAGGFRLLSVQIKADVPDVQTRPENKNLGWRPANGKKETRLTFGSVLFEGRLQVTNADSFREALTRGIGSAKGYGFGLLSIARAVEEPL